MSRRPPLAVALAAAVAMGTAALARPITPPALDGKALFHEKCGMCHGPGGMGRALIARHGVNPPDLDQMSNLTAAIVFQYARRGLGNMPYIPPGEVSDAQLRAIAAYLAAGPHEHR